MDAVYESCSGQVKKRIENRVGKKIIMPENKKCSNCLFWIESHPPDGSKGTCRHYPPIGRLESGITDFPTTDPADYCGEYQADPNGAHKS